MFKIFISNDYCTHYKCPVVNDKCWYAQRSKKPTVNKQAKIHQLKIPLKIKSPYKS